LELIVWGTGCKQGVTSFLRNAWEYQIMVASLTLLIGN
jgi:hypothetical protein